MSDFSLKNCTPEWNALARTPDRLAAQVVAIVTDEIVASACGLESND